MKKILTGLFQLMFFMAFTLFTAVPAMADETISVTTSAGVGSNIYAGKRGVTGLTFINGTGSAITAKLFDASTTGTNYIRQAYTAPLSYSTNYTVISTAPSGVSVTNTFTGTYTTTQTVALATNTLPAILTITVPANTTRTKAVSYFPLQGLTVVANGVLTVEADTIE